MKTFQENYFLNSDSETVLQGIRDLIKKLI